ncbi:MAG: class I SAM-dependent methyltransferase [Burkholderiales bacterium]
MPGPLLTAKVHDALQNALRANQPTAECSLDLDRSTETVEVGPDGWTWRGGRYPYLETCKDRTVYYWDGSNFLPAARFTHSLVKLVPTDWGPPTFEIDGIKMLPTEHVSPWADAEQKVGLVRPGGKAILDTCGGLGYFAACALQAGAKRVQSFEKNVDVIWLRSLNPWSPIESDALTLANADITEQIALIPDGSVDAILHDPPRFGTAGELYSQTFYVELHRVLRRGGKMFHYTGSPNKLTTGRDVPAEVATRLRRAGFSANLSGDGVLAAK